MNDKSKLEDMAAFDAMWKSNPPSPLIRGAIHDACVRSARRCSRMKSEVLDGIIHTLVAKGVGIDDLYFAYVDGRDEVRVMERARHPNDPDIHVVTVRGSWEDTTYTVETLMPWDDHARLPPLPWPHADIDAAFDALRTCTDPKPFEMWLGILEHGATYLDRKSIARHALRLADYTLMPAILEHTATMTVADGRRSPTRVAQKEAQMAQARRLWSAFYGLKQLAVKCGVTP